MKNIMSEMKAKEYFCRLSTVQAKKVVFAMSEMGANTRMSDSNVPELQHIASLYEGVIQGNYASELASKLMDWYTAEHPGTFMTKKETKQYTEVNYIKLITALGVKGFDYVLTALKAGKAMVSDPASEVDEIRMLQALRWKEFREDRNPQISDNHHHKRGLELLGFGEMAERLKDYSFVIANLYEQITPGAQVKQEVIASDTVRQMKIHFIEAAEIIEDFYSVEQPTEPKGYDKTQLAEGSLLLDLAAKGQLKDSEEILAYYQAKVAWDSATKRLEKEFTEEECEVIRNNSAAVKELINNKW